MEGISRPEYKANLEHAMHVYNGLTDIYNGLKEENYNEFFLGVVWILSNLVVINAREHDQSIEKELEETFECISDRALTLIEKTKGEMR